MHNKRTRNPTQSLSSENERPPQKKIIPPVESTVNPTEEHTPVEHKQKEIENDLSDMKNLMQDIVSTVRNLSRDPSPEPFEPVVPEDNEFEYHHDDDIEDPNEEFDTMHY